MLKQIKPTVKVKNNNKITVSVKCQATMQLLTVIDFFLE